MTIDGTPASVVFVGTGNISSRYADSVARHPELRLAGVYDIDRARAAEFAAARPCVAFDSLDDVAASRPDIVVNLTSAPFHYATTKELLRAALVEHNYEVSR